MSKVVLMDGAVGTSLWEKAEDTRPVWRHNVEHPEWVTALHREMADAGAQIVLANTFGANGGAVAKSPYTVERVVRTGVALCRAAVGDRARVALAVGPLSGFLQPRGEISREEAGSLYREMIGAGMKEKPDLIYLQTFMELEMLLIAARCARSYAVPLLCSMSFQDSGVTWAGDTVEEIVAGLAPLQPDGVGLNCSPEPEKALPILERFRQATNLPLVFKPNAGLTTLVEGKPVSGCDGETFVSGVLRGVKLGAAYAGGCCGANAGYIALLRRRLAENGVELGPGPSFQCDPQMPGLRGQ